MFHHTIELSSPFVNESFGVFCLCNFIVALLLLLSFVCGTAAVRIYDEPKKKACNDDDDDESEKHEKEAIEQDEMEVNASIKNDYNEDEDTEDNEKLKRRAEEFIQRMVESWKVEKKIHRSQLMTN